MNTQLYNTAPQNFTLADMSSVDALWFLIMQQNKQKRTALIERLIYYDTEMAERLLLKSSIEKGWNQVKKMSENNYDNGTLQDLISELKK